ncbi:JAB domain-containing protein [Sphingomonas flavescens]|jgi:DNA repair protein RadC|uniref:JAB domain-containing protein n=1 Tax=Sphingomonas flavescens TaxID=3132797 RepID=UPI002805AAFA|nr:JAB domain-containing protein [Sphingomonas limnosediminicola]
MRYQRAELPLKLDGLAAARTFFSDCLAEADQRRETLWVAHVDGQSRCLHLAAYPGEQTGGDFPLREIVIDVAEHGSEGLVLAHNHPSGDARPSDNDKRATRRLAMAADALDCTVLDHLIFAGDECVSLRRMGLL